MWRSTWRVLSTSTLWYGRAGASAAKAAPLLRRRAHSAASARFLATLAKPPATATAVAEPALEEVEEEFQNDDVGVVGRKGSRGPTPAIRQYLAIKNNYPYHILMFRLGDFYEMFFEDAMRAASVLNIALTKRGSAGNEIPMAGIPAHAVETYIDKLIRHKLNVALCDQVQPATTDATTTGRKPKVLHREVTRVISPGTFIDERFLDPREASYLLALVHSEAGDGTTGLVWLDLSTGQLRTLSCPTTAVSGELARLRPREVLVLNGNMANSKDTLDQYSKIASTTVVEGAQYDVDVNNSLRSVEYLLSKVSTQLLANSAPLRLQTWTPAQLTAAAVLFKYVARTQFGRLPKLVYVGRSEDGSMQLDAVTTKSLELHTNVRGERRGSLLSVLDDTVTAAGARLLTAWIQMPLLNPEQIRQRQACVKHFYDDPTLAKDLQLMLKRCSDIERAFQRICLSKGGPRDCTSIAATLAEAMQLKALLQPGAPPDLASTISALGNHDELVNKIRATLVDSPPLSSTDGGFVRPGFSAELDELVALRDNSEKLIIDLQNRYRQSTGITTLKIRQNRVLGYFIEVPARQEAKLLADPQFSHRQALVDRKRFVTQELMTLETKLNTAASSVLYMEIEILEGLVKELNGKAAPIMQTAQALAELDVFSSLGRLARARGYCAPTVDDSRAFEVEGGRHPVVEAMQEAERADFVGNDCVLTDKRLWLVTGPNMGGKSTFLRQNALITVMAQIGSFVPARRAHIGVVDRIFSRVGAADDLANHRSTFMMEMLETATILREATDRSLVIMDEIGRGTSTSDGLALAWACTKQLHDVIKARTLFATHYHELAAMTAHLERVACCKADVLVDPAGELVFLFQITPGAADRSYGIQVAQLAGVPEAVLAEARRTLVLLEDKAAAATLRHGE